MLLIDPFTALTRVRMPNAEDIRRRLAQSAADAVGKEVVHFLGLIGRVEATGFLINDHQAAWRLTSYHGSPADNDVIARAVARVQREFPSVDLD